MDEFESVSWKSGGGVSCCCEVGVPRLAWVEPGGVGETTISRHCMVVVLVLEDGELLSDGDDLVF